MQSLRNMASGSPLHRAAPAAGTKSAGLRSQLKGVGFAEGEAMLKPPSAQGGGGGPELELEPQAPVLAPTQTATVESAPAQGDAAQGAHEPSVPAQGEPATEAAAPASEPWRRYCVPGLDDPDAVQYAAARDALPDRAAAWFANAMQHVEKLEAKDDPGYRRFSKVMSDRKIASIVLYTLQASYAMNAVMRGQLKSDRWKSYADFAREAAAALALAPKGAKNNQGTAHLPELMDETKAADKVLPIGTVYRNDSFNPFFVPVFEKEYKDGAEVTEPAFLSTTLVQGSYASAAPVRRTIEDAKVSRSVSSISAFGPLEKEALFPPGQRFKITDIRCEDTNLGTSKRTAPDPAQLYPRNDPARRFDRPGLIWHIKMRHVGVAKPTEADKSAESKKSPEDKATEAKKPGLLEKILGVAKVLD